MNNKKNNSEFILGVNNFKDYISPSYINLKNPKYLEIDNFYYSGIIITNYHREQNDLLLKNIVETDINIIISCFYEKKDKYKTIKDLTYHIGNTSADLKNSKESREDIDLAVYTYNDAKYIRKEIQLNNADLYFLYIYLILFSRDQKEIEYLLSKTEGILQSSGMITKRAYFREEQCFLSCLPIIDNNNYIKEAARRNILTDGIVSTYPFISSTIFDEEGVFIGRNIYNNSLIFIDNFSKKYKNSNICIFGTSGARKIFLCKTINIKKCFIWNCTIHY